MFSNTIIFPCGQLWANLSEKDKYGLVADRFHASGPRYHAVVIITFVVFSSTAAYRLQSLALKQHSPVFIPPQCHSSFA